MAFALSAQTNINPNQSTTLPTIHMKGKIAKPSSIIPRDKIGKIHYPYKLTIQEKTFEANNDKTGGLKNSRFENSIKDASLSEMHTNKRKCSSPEFEDKVEDENKNDVKISNAFKIQRKFRTPKLDINVEDRQTETLGNTSTHSPVKSLHRIPSPPLMEVDEFTLKLPHPPPDFLLPKGCKRVNDVYVDTFIAKKLLPHQREGITFLYKCVMGYQNSGNHGCVLADEMGLGKTLTCIALLWTLLKQSPFGKPDGEIKKALIVCPVTLITNWRREFRKWLGPTSRIGIFVVDNSANSKKYQRLKDIVVGNIYSVMIIGYEKLCTVLDELAYHKAHFDIVICDEGHRLKNANSKAVKLIGKMGTTKRILLSGTPIQNDLSEFFTMIDFVNPAFFGTYAAFKREYELPITKFRDSSATLSVKQKGKEKLAELISLTSGIVLRRTVDVLKNFLPPKNEFVLFVKLNRNQFKAYKSVVDTASSKEIYSKPQASLATIMFLKKLCNSMSLLSQEESNAATTAKILADESGKLTLLKQLLYSIKKDTDEKVVVVSHYTQTLDVLERVLKAENFSFMRLDGSTNTNKRQGLVDKFNSDDTFIFLLSAKSGGYGINLIGASRLVMFDTDWNPATDLQSMARIHRGGQKRACFIYRLLSSGTIEEKIFQRQLTKSDLSDSMVGDKKSNVSFTEEELKSIFHLYADTACWIHDQTKCPCDQVYSCPEFSDTDSDDNEDGKVDNNAARWRRANEIDDDEYMKADENTDTRAAKFLKDYYHTNPIRVDKDGRISEIDGILNSIIMKSSKTDPVLSFILHKKGAATLEVVTNDDEALVKITEY